MAAEMSEDELKARDKKARERKVLMWGAAIAIPVLLFKQVVQPLYVNLTENREQLELERGALVRERAAIASAKRNPGLQRVADSLMQTTSDRLFSGVDDVMASAELGTYIRDIASKNHFLITTATTGAVSKTRTAVRTLTDDIRGESDLQGILEFLQALERGPKLVRVSRVDLSRPQRDADDIETITFAATITAYALPAELPLPPDRARRASDTTAVGDTATAPAASRGGTP